MLTFLSLFVYAIKSQDIDWFKTTPYHQQNIDELNNGWKECPDWETLSKLDIATISSLGGTITVQLPVTNNSRYNFTALCIKLQVPLNWNPDTISNTTINSNTSDIIETIDYFITRIFSGFHPNNSNGNGAFWMLQGGPGSSGESLYSIAVPWMNFLDDTFDLYIPDHRGTGYSNPLDCTTETIQECAEIMNNTYGDKLHYFSTYQAAMDLGYAVDLFQNNLSVYNETNDIIYGVSYGTYYLNTYLLLFPDQFNAAILDSIVPSDGGRFSQFTNSSNEVGLLFLERCQENEFCNDKFKELNTTIYDATKRIFDNIYNDNDTFQSMNESNGDLHPITNDSIIASLLRATFASYLQSEQARILIPPLIYRATRDTSDDQQVIQQCLASIIGSNLTASNAFNVTENSGRSSPGLYYNVVFSELWDGTNASDPGATFQELVNAEKTYFFSLGMLL